MLILADAAVATGIDMTAITPAISAIGSIGFAFWFGYYTTTKTIPDLQSAHQEQMDKKDAVHAATIDRILNELKESRDSFDRWRSTQH